MPTPSQSEIRRYPPNSSHSLYRNPSPNHPQLGRVRVRQHVNPLRREFMTPTPPPDWNAIFEDASKPLVVDLGCGYGRFLLLTEHKQRDQGFNYLGVEIRKPVRSFAPVDSF